MTEETVELTESQQKIVDILDAVKDLLLYKNRMYGDAALHPKNIFYKGYATNSILNRLDDKIGRIQNNKADTPRVNDVVDLMGYETLLLVSMGVKPSDIAIFKD